MIGLIIPEYIKKFGSDIDTGMVQICPLLITLVWYLTEYNLRFVFNFKSVTAYLLQRHIYNV